MISTVRVGWLGCFYSHLRSISSLFGAYTCRSMDFEFLIVVMGLVGLVGKSSLLLATLTYLLTEDLLGMED